LASRRAAAILLEVSMICIAFAALYAILVPSAPTLLEKVLYSHALMTALALAGMAVGGGSLSRYGVRFRGVGRRVLLCLSLAVVVLGARIATASFLSSLSASTQHPVSMSPSYVAWLFLDLVLLIALPEELFYRGYVQTRIFDALALRGWSDRRAWIASAAIAGSIFGVSHALNLVDPLLQPAMSQGAAAMIISSAIVGFFLGIVRARSGCVWCPTLFHGFLNVSYAIVMKSVSGSAAALSMVVGPLVMMVALRALRRLGRY